MDTEHPDLDALITEYAADPALQPPLGERLRSLPAEDPVQGFDLEVTGVPFAPLGFDFDKGSHTNTVRLAFAVTPSMLDTLEAMRFDRLGLWYKGGENPRQLLDLQAQGKPHLVRLSAVAGKQVLLAQYSQDVVEIKSA